VSRLRQDWAVHEDHALAERLQSREIELHYEGNRLRNYQIRKDFPKALEEQRAEESSAKEVRKVEDQTDEIIARRMAEELSRHDREQVVYEVTRDKLFARKIHALELRRQKVEEDEDKLLHELEQGNVVEECPSKQNSVAEWDSSSMTTALPIMKNGDALSDGQPIGACSSQAFAENITVQPTSADRTDMSFHDLKGGIRYNDHQYMVKKAVPATVVAHEPVYANNRPEHYAVSGPYPAAVGLFEPSSTSGSSCDVFNAAGLSQRDLVLSKRAELQLDQERRDKELAERLQTQLAAGYSSQAAEADELIKRKLEADDLELAKVLHAKERAKLSRAKERSRKKKQRQREDNEGFLNLQMQPGVFTDEFDSMQFPCSLSNTLIPQRSHRLCEEPDPNTDSQFSRPNSNNDVSLPARRPYLNREAIETAIGPPTSSSHEAILSEPHYENVTKKCPVTAGSIVPTNMSTESTVELKAAPSHNTTDMGSVARSKEENTPVPPYMPMQRSTKTSVMEKRIKRRKEKEGCQQQ